MTVLFALLFLLLGTTLLLWGADWFIDGVRDLARNLGLSALVLAILLAGLEPEEMLTSALASAQGAGGLALGDVIGTNITIITLALGLSALIAPIALDRSIRRQALFAGVVSLPAIALLLLGPINRLAGFVLLLLFIGYIYSLWRTDRKAMARMVIADDDDKTMPLKTLNTQPSRARLLLTTLGGLIALAIGGPLIVSGALTLTHAIGLGQEVVGGTIVALGTGSEMLALGVSAARKGHTDILVGGILGSFAYNLLVTMGLAALINPLPALSRVMQPALWLMVAVFLALLFCIWRGKIARLVGWIGVIVYLLYLSLLIITGAIAAI